MELAKAGLVFCGALVLALGIAPAAAHAQLGGLAPGGAEQNMMGKLMAPQPGALHQNAHKTPHQLLEAAKKGMEDADPRVRAESLDKLRWVNSPKALGLLMQGLVDTDVRVRIRAIDILGAQHVAYAVPVMTQQLFLRETPAAVKLHIVAALGRIGDSRGTLPVIEYLRSANNYQSRGTAVFALGEIGDPRASDILIQTLNNDKNPVVRRLAKESLEKIDGELPTARSRQETAERDSQMIPTYQKLSKMRKADQQLQKLGQ